MMRGVLFTLLLWTGASDAGGDRNIAVSTEAGVASLVSAYRFGRVAQGAPFAGVHGLAVDAKGQLYATSFLGQSVYRVDRKTGDVETVAGPPHGESDDLIVRNDGVMFWTGYLSGNVYRRDTDGSLRTIASGLPGINALAFRSDGSLYATQIVHGDALWQLDPEGARAPRKVMDVQGGMNGCEFGADGMLYAPLVLMGKIVRIDVDRAVMTTVSEGFKAVSAVNFDSRGRLFATELVTGELLEIDVQTGARRVVARFKPGLDNLAISRDDVIFVSNMVDGSIDEIRNASIDGAAVVRRIVGASFTAPSGIAVDPADADEVLYMADVFALRSVLPRKPSNRQVTELSRSFSSGLMMPMHVSVAHNRMLLSGWFVNVVQLADRATGNVLKSWTGLKAPLDAILMDDGEVVVAEYETGRLLRWSAERDSGDATQFAKSFAQGLQGPVGLARHGDMVYVTETIGGRVSRVDASGRRQTIASNLLAPEGIAVAGDGALVVAETGRQRLLRIDPQTGAVTPLAEGLPFGIPGLPGLPDSPASLLMTGVAVGRSGTIYFSSDLDRALYRLTPMDNQSPR